VRRLGSHHDRGKDSPGRLHILLGLLRSKVLTSISLYFFGGLLLRVAVRNGDLATKIDMRSAYAALSAWTVLLGFNSSRGHPTLDGPVTDELHL